MLVNCEYAKWMKWRVDQEIFPRDRRVKYQQQISGRSGSPGHTIQAQRMQGSHEASPCNEGLNEKQNKEREKKKECRTYNRKAWRRTVDELTLNSLPRKFAFEDWRQCWKVWSWWGFKPPPEKRENVEKFTAEHRVEWRRWQAAIKENKSRQADVSGKVY